MKKYKNVFIVRDGKYQPVMPDKLAELGDILVAKRGKTLEQILKKNKKFAEWFNNISAGEYRQFILDAYNFTKSDLYDEIARHYFSKFLNDLTN